MHTLEQRELPNRLDGLQTYRIRQHCALSPLTKVMILSSPFAIGAPGRVNLNQLVRRLLYFHQQKPSPPLTSSQPLFTFVHSHSETHQPREPFLSHLSMGGDVWCNSACVLALSRNNDNTKGKMFL